MCLFWQMSLFFFRAPLSKVTVLLFATKVKQMKNPVGKRNQYLEQNLFDKWKITTIASLYGRYIQSVRLICAILHFVILPFPSVNIWGHEWYLHF